MNKLITNIKNIYKQILKAIKDPEIALNPDSTREDNANHDSDEEGTFIDRPSHGKNLPSHRSGDANKSHQDGASDDGLIRYAPLPGLYYFHTKIPYLRRLWRYRWYRRRNARRQNNRWKDTYVWEYPLQHYRRKAIMGLLRGLVAVLALLGSEKHQRVRERDKKRRERKEDGSESSDSDEGGSSRGSMEQEEVDRRDFGGGGARRRKVRRKRSIASGYLEDVPLERWSNQTRSGRSGASFAGEEVDDGDREELSVPPPEGKKIGDLSWFKRMRKRNRGRIADEEKEVGASEMVLEER